MRLPFVSRERYEEARADRREAFEYAQALVQIIRDMKKDGFNYRKPVDPNKPAPQPTATSIEDIARDGARKEFIDNMTSQLRRAGIGDAEARTEATRLAGEMYNTYGEGD